MSLLRHKGKGIFRLVAEVMLTLGAALPVCAAVHPVQHSAREQINAQVLHAATQVIEAQAQKAQWQDYRYTFNVFIPSMVTNATVCPSPLHLNLTSPPDMALSRMNYEVSCQDANGWKVNVGVRPDVFVAVVMPRSLIPRNTEITADDIELKKFNISNQHGDVLMHPEDVVGLTSKRALQPGKPLTAAELVQPLLVKRDQPVMIVSRMQGITASMPGVAMKNGHKGDVIRVRNATSQRVISGVVDQAGVVETLNATP